MLKVIKLFALISVLSLAACGKPVPLSSAKYSGPATVSPGKEAYVGFIPNNYTQSDSLNFLYGAAGPVVTRSSHDNTVLEQEEIVGILIRELERLHLVSVHDPEYAAPATDDMIITLQFGPTALVRPYEYVIQVKMHIAEGDRKFQKAYATNSADDLGFIESGAVTPSEAKVMATNKLLPLLIKDIENFVNTAPEA